MRSHRFNMVCKFISLVAVPGIGQWPGLAAACGGTTAVAQIESGGSLYIFPGFGQIGVTGTADTRRPPTRGASAGTAAPV
jgi:hypothetical protein